MTSDIQDEVANRAQRVETGPLIQREDHVSWFRRLEEKLRAVHAALTCIRSSDAPRASQRPPRPSMHRQDPRPQVSPPLHSSHRQEPRPRLTPQATPRPPPPHQAGGSGWHEQQQPPSEAGGSAWQHASRTNPGMGWHPEDNTFPTYMGLGMYSFIFLFHINSKICNFVRLIYYPQQAMRISILRQEPVG